MTTQKHWEEELREILKGIDQEESDSDEGWWATSTGQDFGTKKLNEVINLISKVEKEAEERGIRRCIESLENQKAMQNHFGISVIKDHIAAFLEDLIEEFQEELLAPAPESNSVT